MLGAIPMCMSVVLLAGFALRFAPRVAPRMMVREWEESSFHGFQVRDITSEEEPMVDLGELETLVAAWQEEQAIADETGAPATAKQQASMMSSWRAMLARREADLVREAAAGRQKSE